MAAAPGSLAQDAVQLLAGPVLMRMVHTRDGAAVACSVLSYGTAAERSAHCVYADAADDCLQSSRHLSS